jgi:hypothetical protein
MSAPQDKKKGSGTELGKANERAKDGRKLQEQRKDDHASGVDRPGFDLGGASGDRTAGKGLGLGRDAKEARDDWGLPRE